MGDLQQLLSGVVRELDLVGKTAGKAAVGGEEGLHLLGVTRQNDHQLIPVILHSLYKSVDGFQPEAVLLAAVEAVCFVNEEHTAQSALDDAVGQGGGVAGVAAHQVGTGHLHQLPALEGTDGFQVFRHQPGNGGLAGAGVSGEDHVHGQAGRFQPGSGPALLYLQVVGQTEHIFFHGSKAHQFVDLGPDGIQCAGIGRRQQVEQGLVCAVVQTEQQPFRTGGQGRRAGQGLVRAQAVFAQGTEDTVTAFGQPGGTLLCGALGCDIVPHVGPGGKGQPQPGADLLGQRVELLCGKGGQVLPGVGGRLADIPQRRHQRCAEFVGQCLPALVGVEDEVFAAGVDAADGSRGQRRACIHKDALLVHEIPAGQGGAALDGQIGQGLQKAGIAALIVLKGKDLSGRVQGGVEVLQEELFGSGIGVKGQIQRGDPVALQKTPGRHAAGSFFQRKMPACACPACEQDDVAGGGGFGAKHKGAAHGPHHAVHKSILPQHRLFDLGGKAFKAAQVLRLHVGGAPGQQAFVLHVPQHLAAAFQRGGGGIALGFELGVLLLQQLVQPFLLFQKRRVQVRQGGAAACFGCRSAGGGLESAPRAEHAVHQTFPIIGVCHKTSLRAVFFLSV